MLRLLTEFLTEYLTELARSARKLNLKTDGNLWLSDAHGVFLTWNLTRFGYQSILCCLKAVLCQPNLYWVYVVVEGEALKAPDPNKSADDGDGWPLTESAKMGLDLRKPLND